MDLCAHACVSHIPQPSPRLTVAVTVVFAFMVTVQLAVPLQPAPLQPVKTELLLAAAISVTDVPILCLSKQSEPQVIPPGKDVTVPLPVPVLVTVRVKVCLVTVRLTVAVAVPPLPSEAV